MAIGWTVISTREYPAEELNAFSDAKPVMPHQPNPAQARSHGRAWFGVGSAFACAVYFGGLDKQLYLLASGITVYGLALLWLSRSGPENLFTSIMADLHGMPETMRKLALVQFFSWFALFAMWIFTTAAVAEVHFGSSDPQSAAYNDGANWVGVLFGAYNGFAALAAIVIPFMVRAIGLRKTHMTNLWIGGLGLLSIVFIDNPHWLLLSMVGVGIAWASILSLPYAMLSDSVPTEKMGTYMGIFNFFIVIPQLVALAIGAISLFIAGLTVLRLQPFALQEVKPAAQLPVD